MLYLNGILTGLEDVIMGTERITWDNLPAVRAMVGVVFQSPDDQLFSPTVFEDIAFGPLHMGLPKDEVLVRVDSALEAVTNSGLSKFGEDDIVRLARSRLFILAVFGSYLSGFGSIL